MRVSPALFARLHADVDVVLAAPRHIASKFETVQTRLSVLHLMLVQLE